MSQKKQASASLSVELSLGDGLAAYVRLNVCVQFQLAHTKPT